MDLIKTKIEKDGIKMMKVKKAVAIMGYDNGSNEYDVYTHTAHYKNENNDPYFNNGNDFSITSIFFTKEEGMKIVDEMIEAECFGEFDEVNKKFVFCTVPFDGNHKEDEELVSEFFEEYGVILAEFEGQEIEVYEIGNGNWDFFIKETEGK